MFRNISQCVGLFPNLNASDRVFGTTQGLELWHMYIMMAVCGMVTVAVALGFIRIRKVVFRDKENIDTDFDAGGKVSVGITAATIVSQWTWAATLLQSCTVAAKYGISGPFWYAAGATIQILLFAMISVQLKVRAPGAKTFLRVIQARFGKRTHLTFTVFAMLTNVIVTAMLMLGGAAVMINLVKGLSLELATGLVVLITCTYTYIGGLGATFYVSYLNVCFVYVVALLFLNKVYYSPDEQVVGTVHRMYTYLNCSIGPSDNLDNSYLTMVSDQGFMFGIINIVGNFGTVFVDQSYWQSSVAAKPKQGVWGFLSGGVTWFAVPFTFATTMGLAYIVMSEHQGSPLLSADDVNRGLVAPVVAQQLMGKPGEVLITLMMLMAITTTGSSEIMAVTSILVYDIYQLYLKPFRLVHDANTCILCGHQRGRNAHPRDKCSCISMTYCQSCSDDDESRAVVKRLLKPQYKCRTHGQYRTYNDYLLRTKNWCLLYVSIAIIPLTMILNALEVSLGWVYLFMGIVIGSAVVPIVLCMFWARLTGVAMMAGGIGGAGVGIVSWLTVAALQDGGLTDFFTSTGKEVSMLTGNLCSILSGGLITIVVTFITNRHFESAMSDEVWENTRDIDNPLSPWTELYARDLGLDGVNTLDNRPSLQEVSKTFRGAKLVANIGAISLTVVLVIFWPSVMTAVGVMGEASFTSWVGVSAAWGYIAAVFIIVFPIVSEVWEILNILKEKRRVGDMFMTRDNRPVTAEAAQKKKVVSPPNIILGSVSEGEKDKELCNGVTSGTGLNGPDSDEVFATTSPSGSASGQPNTEMDKVNPENNHGPRDPVF